MTILRSLIPTIWGLSKSTLGTVCSSRTFSSLKTGYLSNISQRLPQTVPSAISQAPFLEVNQQCRTYKHKDVLKRRCAGCYFVRRFGILYIECDLKPRHRQVKKMRGDQYYRDDYSKGKWMTALNWGWRQKNYYKGADPKFVKYNWFEGKVGTEV